MAIDILPPARVSDRTTVGLWQIDRGGITLGVNPAMRQLLELDEDAPLTNPGGLPSAWGHSWAGTPPSSAITWTGTWRRNIAAGSRPLGVGVRERRILHNKREPSYGLARIQHVSIREG